jgi:hypothetical protein
MAKVTIAEISLPEEQIACGKDRYAELCNALLRHMPKKAAVITANLEDDDPWMISNVKGWLLYAARHAADPQSIGVRRKFGPVTQEFAENFLGSYEASTFIPIAKNEEYRQILMMKFVELAYPLLQCLHSQSRIKDYYLHYAEQITAMEDWLLALISTSKSLSADMVQKVRQSHHKARASWAMPLPPGSDPERELVEAMMPPAPIQVPLHTNPPAAGFPGHQPTGFLVGEEGNADASSDETDEASEEEASPAPKKGAKNKRLQFQRRQAQRQAGGAKKKQTAAAKNRSAAQRRAAPKNRRNAVGKGKYQRKR